MESLLTAAGWKAIHSPDGIQSTLDKQVVLYKQITHTEAWKDYQFRLKQLREATRSQIERGGVDKFGNRHDDEQRSILYMLDQMLSYLPAIHEHYEQIQSHLAAQEAMAGQPLYGEDQPMHLTSPF